MEQILYIPSFDEMLKEYADAGDLRCSYERYGCTGLEIIRCDYGSETGGQDEEKDTAREGREKQTDREGREKGVGCGPSAAVQAAAQAAAANRAATGSEWISPNMIRGVHMIFYPLWLDFWRGNEEALAEEFGDRETWEGFYLGKTPETLIDQFTADLEYAKRVGAQYVVFHVSDVTIEGVFTHEHTHTDEEVIDGTIEVINRILDGKDYEFDFLMENLWWPGLTMTDPQMTKRLLDGVHYKRKGIMLDLGHLMCSNMDLTTEEEAIDYVDRMLEAHRAVLTADQTGEADETGGGPGRPLTEYIKGIHMHQSVTGAFAKRALEDVRANGLQLEADYYGRFSQVYKLLGNIDTHKPFSSPLAKGLVQRIAPQYVVHELMAKSRQERDEMLAQQSGLLK